MSKARTRTNLPQVWRCSKGVTAIEYALIAGTIAAVIIFTVASVGKQLDTTFQKTTTELSGMPGTGGGGGGSSDGDGGSDNTGNDGGSDGGASNDGGGDDDNDGRGGGRGRGRGR
jgi:Flp pilus assembly pilin Flp